VTAGAKSAVEGVLLQKSLSLGMKCARCGAAARKLRAVGSKYHEDALVQLAASLENRLHSTARDPAAYFDPSAMDPVKNLLHQLISRLEEAGGRNFAPRLVPDGEGHVSGSEGRA